MESKGARCSASIRKRGIVWATVVLLAVTGTLRLTARGADELPFTELHVFPVSSEGHPYQIIQGTDGNFYIAAQSGTTNKGAVLRMSVGGSVTVLHAFSGADGSDVVGLMQASDGMFYGTTNTGGASNHGAIFRLTSSGAFTLLYSFPGGPNGELPASPPVEASDGNFYGTALGGDFGRGIVYRMTKSGTVTVLHSFSPAEGVLPKGLLQARDGLLYGSTQGRYDGPGSIFKMTLTGQMTVLKTFSLGADGGGTPAPIVQGPDGNLYGTSYGGFDSSGNRYGGNGIAFKMSLEGTFQIIHAFSDTEGAPSGAFILGGDGNLYGSTEMVQEPPRNSGRYTAETAYRMTPGGAVSVLHTFSPEGYVFGGDWNGIDSLLYATDGELYGVTLRGGPRDPSSDIKQGTAFRIDLQPTTPPLPAAPPFGSFDTPADGAVATGAIALTGWALDDSSVTKVDILRDAHPQDPPTAVSGGKVFVATATFVTGARPDIAANYATYPNASRAGWGYMMLTRGLIWDGQGQFNLYAVATDRDGNATVLGTKRITINNAAATKPFGNIDTPGQGATVSGSFVNFGWVLGLSGRTIPAANVQVSIDGQILPQTSECYTHRADIDQGFAGFDTSHAIRCFTIDTTKYPNGLHTIGWLVTDSAGQADGIGSRFFTIANSATQTGSQSK